jgi:hypothetical protein
MSTRHLSQRLDQAGDHFLGRVLLVGIVQAVHRIFLNDQHRSLMHSAPNGRQLRHNIRAVALFFEHTPHTPNLSLDPLQAPD